MTFYVYFGLLMCVLNVKGNLRTCEHGHEIVAHVSDNLEMIHVSCFSFYVKRDRALLSYRSLRIPIGAPTLRR